MDLANLIPQEELIKRRSQIKKVFFYRICGAGMGPAAVLVKQAGFQVEGADSAFYPPMSTFLETTGIPLFKLDQVTPEFLKQYDGCRYQLCGQLTATFTLLQKNS